MKFDLQDGWETWQPLGLTESGGWFSWSSNVGDNITWFMAPLLRAYCIITKEAMQSTRLAMVSWTNQMKTSKTALLCYVYLVLYYSCCYGIGSSLSSLFALLDFFCFRFFFINYNYGSFNSLFLYTLDFNFFVLDCFLLNIASMCKLSLCFNNWLFFCLLF